LLLPFIISYYLISNGVDSSEVIIIEVWLAGATTDAILEISYNTLTLFENSFRGIKGRNTTTEIDNFYLYLQA
jgi:hypothetical protein